MNQLPTKQVQRFTRRSSGWREIQHIFSGVFSSWHPTAPKGVIHLFFFSVFSSWTADQVALQADPPASAEAKVLSGPGGQSGGSLFIRIGGIGGYDWTRRLGRHHLTSLSISFDQFCWLVGDALAIRVVCHITITHIPEPRLFLLRLPLVFSILAIQTIYTTGSDCIRDHPGPCDWTCEQQICLRFGLHRTLSGFALWLEASTSGCLAVVYHS